MVPNSWKLDLRSRLGALWAPFWHQDGPIATPRAKDDAKYSILGSPELEPKSIKNLIKNRLDFCYDFESTFFRSWVDFGSKNLSKMRGLRVTFSTLLRICEKCDLEQPSPRFAIFFDFRRVGFRPEKICFSDVFLSKKRENVRFQTIFSGKSHIIERQFSQNVTVSYVRYSVFF